ncbi:hypothetical protein TNCV_2464591 [Trichonephila clavipes]|nr:hypothetical protein TNCV_2464591 [Trichonephila clavipes]
MANWSQCEEFPKRKQKKGETIPNRTLSKKQKLKNHSNRSHLIFLLQPPSNKNKTPELRPPPKKPLDPMKIKITFGFNDAEDSSSTTPFFLEMGRQFRNAKRRREDCIIIFA